MSGRGMGGHGSTALDPFDEDLDVRVREFAGGRHFKAFVADGLNEGAVGEAIGNNGRPGITAAADECGLIKPKSTLLLVGAVAFDAVPGEEWADLGFEEADFGGVGGGFVSGAGGGSEGGKEQD